MSGLTIFNFLLGMLAFTLVLIALFNLFDLSAKCKYLCGCNKKCNDGDCCDAKPCCTPCNKEDRVRCFTADTDCKECTPCKCKK